MKRGLFVLLVVAVLGAMQGWNISRAQTPDDENACELRQFYSEVVVSSSSYTVTPEEQQEFPAGGGSLIYYFNAPMGTSWQVVPNSYWVQANPSSGVKYTQYEEFVVLTAPANDSIEPGRTGITAFTFSENFKVPVTLYRYYFQLKR